MVTIEPFIHRGPWSIKTSSCSMPLQERRCFHDFTPLFAVVSFVPGRPQSQILLFEVVLDGTQPCLTRTTARSSPLLRRVVDAGVEGT